jgi:predicted ATP-binding protein involved in virulence
MKGRGWSRLARSDIEDLIPSLERIGYDEWLESPTGESLSYNEIIERYDDVLPVFRKTLEQKWYPDLINSINVRFIKAERLITFPRLRSNRSPDTRPVVAVLSYSRNLVKKIQETYSEYAKFSQNLDRTFIKRLLSYRDVTKLSSSVLIEKLSELQKKRMHLVEIGLLEKEQEEDIDPIELKKVKSSDLRKMLSAYTSDYENKLNIYNDLSGRIELFKEIVNKKFKYKRMVIDKNEGLVFFSEKGDKLSPTNLSSGEQHELILLYELLFIVKPNSLILIDEPELSLHLSWQQEFIQDLLKIIQISQFDALIATHSPEIIYDKWDLTVELKGP